MLRDDTGATGAYLNRLCREAGLTRRQVASALPESDWPAYAALMGVDGQRFAANMRRRAQPVSRAA